MVLWPRVRPLGGSLPTEALLTVREGRGMLRREEVLEEITRMQEKAARGTVRPFHLAAQRLRVRGWAG
jgi:hypothetical protein